MTSMKQKTIGLLENIISKGAVTKCDLSFNYSYSNEDTQIAKSSFHKTA